MNRRIRTARVVLVFVVCLALVTSVLVPTTVAGQATLGDLQFAGDGTAGTQGGTTYLWASESLQVTGTLRTDGGTGPYDLCATLRAAGNGSDQQLTCQSLSAEGTASFSLAVDSMPENVTGAHMIDVTLRNTSSSTVTDSASLSVHILRKDGDLDGDGLSNQAEFERGTRVDLQDTDYDGLNDGPEVNAYDTNPNAADTDGDGLDDYAEVETYDTDPTKTDTDDDGLNDTVEVNTFGTSPTEADTDGDGLNDGIEINTYETNATNPDTDGDGLDDGKEVELETNPNDTDTDGDGLNDNLEVNTYDTNPTKADTDGDGLEDGAEVNKYHTDPTKADSDGDGLDDGEEINTYDTNPTDSDTDDDGLSDGAEVNTYGTDPKALDTDGDGINDGKEVADERLANALVYGFALLFAIAALAGLAVVLVRSGRVSWPPDIDLPTIPMRGEEESTDEGGGPPSEPVEIMSDEERVLALLDDHGGRLKQSAIIDETGWSKSKVSRVLSRMADDGQVTKINIGRGNLIALPGDEPEGAGHPFDQ